MQIMIVTDDVQYWSFLHEFPIVEAEEYLKGGPYQSPSIRVINLCQSYRYQTIGYYVSLLALAQDQKVSPSVQMIQDCVDKKLSSQFLQAIEPDIQQTLSKIEGNSLILNIYFGLCSQQGCESLAKKIHAMFPLPLITLKFVKKGERWLVKRLAVLATKDIPQTDEAFMRHAAQLYLTKKRFYQGRKKQYFFYLAILTEKHESEGTPSNKKALDLFAEAGESLGIQVDFIDHTAIKSVPEYASLFIRAPTLVNNYTYKFARYAAQENLVVIDDPQSIVKCSNKVYLAVMLQHHRICAPQTTIISKYHADYVLPEFPCVIKKPDSSCSLGVVKVHNEKELKKTLKQFFKTSDLVVMQPFIPTDFDWRIGILDNKPLFASRYYMAKDHWQIVNWKSNTEQCGYHESVPLNAVPEGLLQTALRATRLIGDGLYGVDIKTRGEEHYVIEVNDNPSIDYGDEDQILGDGLYMSVMQVFLQRMQLHHGWHKTPHQLSLETEK